MMKLNSYASIVCTILSIIGLTSCSDSDNDYVVNSVINNIDGDKVYNLTFGESAPIIMSGKDPNDYMNLHSFDIEEAQEKSSQYEIEATAVFTEPIANEGLDHDSDATNAWNPESKLCSVVIKIETQSKWGKDKTKQLCSAFAKKGFKHIEWETDNDEGGGFLRKGNIWCTFEYSSDSCELTIIDINTFPDGEAVVESLISKLPSEHRAALRVP